MKLIEVTWFDAFISLKVYTKENASNRRGVQKLRTTGYLVHEDKLRIVLAMQESVDNDTEVRHLCWIPKGCIINKREIKERNK